MTASGGPASGLQTVEWAVCSRALAGQAVSGDLHIVAARARGVLVGAIDGLGHGPEAAAAARIVAAVIEQHVEEDLKDILQCCHAELRGTRGVAASLAALDTACSEIGWVGVGDVAAMVVRASGPAGLVRSVLVPRHGVIGYRLPTIDVANVPLALGDTLIFTTDGIRPDVAPRTLSGLAPHEMADEILRAYGRLNDDALVLVVRYLGVPA